MEDLVREVSTSTALDAALSETEAAIERLEDADHESATAPLWDLVAELDDERTRRQGLEARARTEVDFNGHLVGAPWVRGHVACTCGWSPESGPGRDVFAQAIDHAAANGGASLVDGEGRHSALWDELWP